MASEIRRRRWPRRIIYSFLALVAAGASALLIYIYSGHPDRYLRERMLAALGEVLGRPVALERVTIRYLPPGVVVEGFKAEGQLLSAERVDASISLTAWLRGRIVIGDLELYKPLLHWDVDTESFLPVREERRESWFGSRLDLERLSILDGEVIIGSQRRVLSLEVEDLSVHADNRGPEEGGLGVGFKGLWIGAATFRRGSFLLGDLAIDGMAGSVAFEADPAHVKATRLRLVAEGVDIRGRGDVFPGVPARARFNTTVVLDPEAPSITRPLRQFSARQMSSDATVTLSMGQLRITGSYVAHAPSFDLDRKAASDGPEAPWRAERATGSFMMTAGRLEIGGQLDLLASGTLRGSYLGLMDEAEPAGRRRHQVWVEGRGLKLAELLEHFDWPGDDRVPPSASVAGTATTRWTGDEIRKAQGSANLTFSPAPGKLPLEGVASLTWTGRRVRIASSSLQAPGSSLEMTGTMDATGRPIGLELSGTLVSRDTTPLAEFLQARFPTRETARPALRPTDLKGQVTARIAVTGTSARPEVRADFESSDLIVSLPLPAAQQRASRRVELDLDAARGTLRYRPDRLEVQVDEARREGLAAKGLLIADPSRNKVLGLDLDAASVPAGMVARFIGLDTAKVPVTGSARGAVHLAASDGELEGTLWVEADEAVMGQLRLGSLKAQAVLEDQSLRLRESSASLFGGMLRAEGSLALRPDGARGTIDLQADGIDLGAVDAAYAGPSLAGRADVAGQLTIDEEVSARATLTGQAVQIAGIDLGVMTGSMSGPLERLHFELKDESGALHASGDFAPAAGLRLADQAQEASSPFSGMNVSATITAEKFSLDEIRPLFPPGALAGLKGDADGTIRINGPLEEPAQIEVEALLNRISLTAGRYPLHNDEPVRLTVRDGFLTLSTTRLVGEKTDLTLQGSMALRGGYEATARIEGSYDLGLAEILFPEMRASGPGTASLSMVQRGDSQTYSGTLTLDGGSIVHPALPSPLENVTARGQFTQEGLLKVEGIRFSMGGGNALGNGWVRFEGASVPQLHLSLFGVGVRAEILPDLRAFFDADVTLDKDGRDYRFAGEVTIQRAIYSRAFGVEPTELLLRSREFAPARERRLGAPTVFLDLDIVAEGDVWIRNEEALIEAAAHLSLEGTLEEPELSGRISALEGGTYRFRDVTYRIVGGALDFADLTRIDPLIDIEAVTRVQQYEVTLRISGRFSKPVYELTSEPPLPQREIVSLLITGQTVADTPGDPTRAISEAQVASYLAAPVAGVVSAPLEKILGVSSVQIDPFFLSGTADPSARVTITKRMRSNLLFTWSSSLGQSGEEIYQLAYNPGRLWDLLGTRDEDGSIGTDVRFRRRWKGWNPLSDEVQDQEGVASGDGLGAPEQLRVGEIRLVADHLVDSQRSLIRRLPFDAGDPFRRGDLLEGREILRQHYVEQGYPAAQVEVIEEDTDPAQPARRDIRYVIRAGPSHELEIQGEVRERSIRKAVRAAWEEPILLEDLVEEARKAALGFLKGKGFYSAQADAALESPEPDRRVVKLDLQPGPRVRVRSTAISGNAGMPEDRIRRQMLTHEDTLPDIFRQGLLKEVVLEDDVASIRALYLASGYLSVKIAPPVISVSPDGTEADVRISIEEGPQSRIGGISIEGQAPGVPGEELIRAVDLSLDQILTADKVSLAADRLREELDRKGYSRARVSYRLEGPPERTRVVFSITPLERARVQEVIFEGNTRTRSRIVGREIIIDSGDYLSRSAMLTTQRNLYRLGVFSSVQIDTEPVEGKPGFVNLRIRLQEGSPILTAWSVGYDTQDRARASFEVGNNNLFGTRRSAALFLRGSSVDRRVQVTLRDPNLFGERIETLVSSFLEEQEFESFDLRRLGAITQLSRKAGANTTLFGRYRLEDISLFNLRVKPADTEAAKEEAGVRTVKLASIGASMAYDTRDDVISPSHGWFSSFDARVYDHQIGSESEFTRLFGSASYFREIGKGIVWASSMRAGLITSKNIPITERFFAGGDTTLRGFAYNTVGPDDPDTGKPVGGNGLVLINQEMRFPIFRALKGVVFYDAGNVYDDFKCDRDKNHKKDENDYDCRSGILRHVGGLGLRFDTPVGPFRIEYGRKLDREKGESPGHFFFSIGQAF